MKLVGERGWERRRSRWRLGWVPAYPIRFTFCSAPGRPCGTAGAPGGGGQPRGAALVATSWGTYDHPHPLRGGRVGRQPGRGHAKGESPFNFPASWPKVPLLQVPIAVCVLFIINIIQGSVYL